MENRDKIKIEATGEFPFKFFIEKAVASEEEHEFIIEGIASTTNIDHDSERMAESALRSMEAAINKDGVPLRVEHQKEDEAIIGKVYEARVDERNQLHVKARLDKAHPASSILYNSMKTGAKMGLSVGGLVKHAVRELSEKTGKMVKTFYDVALKEVSVTPRPANYDSWLVAKSIADDEEDGDRFRDSAIYREFLFENPQLDYLAAFAKSIPDSAWHKVASQDNNDNSMETKKTEDTTDTTEKAVPVSRAEFNALSGLVSKGFESMTALVSKALNSGAMDQNHPDEKKPEEVGDKAAMKSEDAKDQNNPDQAKPKEVGDGTAKSEDNGTDENGTREKAEETSETSKTEETDTTKTTDETYELESVERAVKSIAALTERMNKTEETTEEKTKTTDETKETSKTEDETDTMKGIHPLDAFVSVVSKALEAMEKKMEETGKSIPGFEKSMINRIREDKALQQDIAELLKMPGFKKSVAMGTPYVRTKDGRQFALTMSDVQPTTVEKSRGEEGKKDFKTMYKSDFASTREDA